MPTRLVLIEDHPALRKGLALLLGHGPEDGLAAAHDPGVALEDLLQSVRAAVEPAAAPALEPARPQSLSKREREVVDLLAQGLTGEQVADLLVLSAETVKTHIRNAMSKLEATTRAHAVALALRDGQISAPAFVADVPGAPAPARVAPPRATRAAR